MLCKDVRGGLNHWNASATLATTGIKAYQHCGLECAGTVLSYLTHAQTQLQSWQPHASAELPHSWLLGTLLVPCCLHKASRHPLISTLDTQHCKEFALQQVCWGNHKRVCGNVSHAKCMSQTALFGAFTLLYACIATGLLLHVILLIL